MRSSVLFLLVLASLAGSPSATEAQAHPRATCAGLENCCDDTEPASCKPADYKKTKVALVFGADAYESTFGASMPDLKNARNDAVTVGRTLAKAGFEIRYVLDATRDRAVREISRFADYIRQRSGDTDIDPEQSRAVVYFAGHGLSDGQTDHLIFRAPNMPDAEFMMSTDAVSRFFYALRIFDVAMIFDVCRTLGKLPQVSGRGPIDGKTFVTEQFALDGTQHVVVRTTGRQAPAIDMPKSGNTKNGIYVREFAFFASRPNFTPHQIFEFTSSAVAASEPSQLPQSQTQSALKAANVPWNSTKSACATLEFSLWYKASSFCTRHLAKEKCLKELCKVWHADPKPKLDSDIACMRPDVFDRLGKLDEICSSSEFAGLSGRIGRFETATLDLKKLREIAIAAAPEVVKERSSIDEAILENASAELVTTSLEGQKVRNTFLKPLTAQKVGLPLDTSLPANFKAWPKDDARPIFSTDTLQTTWGSVRQDCVNIKCGGGWTGVSVSDGGFVYRGHLPVSKLPKPAGGPRVKLTFENGQFNIAPQAAKTLRDLAQKARSAGGGATITAIVAGDDPAADRYLPESRILAAEMMIRSTDQNPLGLAEENIVQTIVNVQNKSDLPELVVDFLIPDVKGVELIAVDD